LQFFRLKPYKTAFFEVAISKFDILKSPLEKKIKELTAKTKEEKNQPYLDNLEA
jgi:hypothetical protein